MDRLKAKIWFQTLQIDWPQTGSQKKAYVIKNLKFHLAQLNNEYSYQKIESINVLEQYLYKNHQLKFL